jgi:transposase
MKDNELRLFRTLFVDQNKTAKEAALIVGISEKTASDWVRRYGLKEIREAKQNAPDMTIVKLKQDLDRMIEEKEAVYSRSDLNDTQKAKLRRQLADEVSKWTKALREAKDDSRIPLSVYLKVMEMLFDAIRDKHPKIYLQLLDFQEKHIYEVALRYQ